MTLTGKVMSGARRAAGFTQLGWVQDQCLEKLGFKPYPGTLNVEISPESLGRLQTLERAEGPVLIPPDPASCSARIFPIKAGAVSAALVMPVREVRIHERRVIEIIAPVSLRWALKLKDGDRITLTLPDG